MNAEVFIDTNVFLYAISDRPDEKLKTQRARDLLLNQNWGGQFKSPANSLALQSRPTVSFKSRPTSP